jgi:hypothetical protein
MSYNEVCPAQAPIYTEPTVVYRDHYIPQPVQVIHPVEIVDRYHCVPVPQHIVQYQCRQEQAVICSNKPSRNKTNRNKRRR